MPPVNPPLKNDGPACRVCGCTEHNACRHVIVWEGPLTCSWVETTGADSGALCSACAGTDNDLAESWRRARDIHFAGIAEKGKPRKVAEIMDAATRRYRHKKGIDAGR